LLGSLGKLGLVGPGLLLHLHFLRCLDLHVVVLLQPHHPPHHGKLGAVLDLCQVHEECVAFLINGFGVQRGAFNVCPPLQYALNNDVDDLGGKRFNLPVNVHEGLVFTFLAL